MSAPVPHGPWEYYTRTVEGKQYAVHCRRARGAGADGDEQILLDENEPPTGTSTSRSAGSTSHPTIACSRTPSTRPAASASRCGSAISTRASTSTTSIDDVTYGLAWADDARTCFYVRPDDAMRP